MRKCAADESKLLTLLLSHHSEKLQVFGASKSSSVINFVAVVDLALKPVLSNPAFTVGF